VLANEDAARRLTGLEPEQAVLVLAEGRQLACVTLGPAGAFAAAGDRVEHAKPPAIAADAPGAGDAFAGAFLAALARREKLPEALARACRAALDSLA
jgi:sugar/nucleoside kinase (ribokinase family)